MSTVLRSMPTTRPSIGGSRLSDRSLKCLEWIGGQLGLAAAAMVAFNQPWSGYAYLLFVAGSLMLLVFFIVMRHYGLVVQQAGFLVINLVGTYCWLLSSCHAPAAQLLAALEFPW